MLPDVAGVFDVCFANYFYLAGIMTLSLRNQQRAAIEQLQLCLQTHGYWEASPPDSLLIASEQPFSVDTLSVTQWLQWRFIPQVLLTLEQGKHLPHAMEISPYIAHVLLGEKGAKDLIEVSQKIDLLFARGVADV